MADIQRIVRIDEIARHARTIVHQLAQSEGRIFRRKPQPGECPHGRVQIHRPGCRGILKGADEKKLGKGRDAEQAVRHAGSRRGKRRALGRDEGDRAGIVTGVFHIEVRGRLQAILRRDRGFQPGVNRTAPRPKQ